MGPIAKIDGRLNSGRRPEYRLEVRRQEGYETMPLDLRVWLSNRSYRRAGAYGRLARLLHVHVSTLLKWTECENGIASWRVAQIRAAIEMELI